MSWGNKPQYTQSTKEKGHVATYPYIDSIWNPTKNFAWFAVKKE